MKQPLLDRAEDPLDPLRSPNDEIDPRVQFLRSVNEDEGEGESEAFGRGDDDDDEFQYHVYRRLTWDDSGLTAGLSQMYGSVWPRVIPFCLFNVLLTFVVWCLKHYRNLDLTVSPSGHTYAATLMSFLLVTRLKILYDRYMENARNLSFLCKATRDLTANMCVLTSNDASKRAKQWRQDVTYAALLFLRVAVGVLLFRSNENEHPWRLPEFLQESEGERSLYSFDAYAQPDTIHSQRKLNKFNVLSQQQKQTQPSPTQQSHNHCEQTPFNSGKALPSLDEDQVPKFSDDCELLFGGSLRSSKLKHALAHVHNNERKEIEEIARAPFVLAMNVRIEILKQRDQSWFQDRSKVFEHPCNEETRLLDLVGDALKAFSGLYKNITTHIPFPLIQMNELFLFVWLFTLPLVMTHVRFNRNPVNHPLIPLCLVFVLTFGFLGLEFVCLELTDTFGNYPSDFDALGFCQLCMEDCYVSIYRCDGKEWANALRKRFRPKRERA